ADQENKKVIEDRRKSDESASTWTVVIALISTLVALVLGIVIAYTSAKSITQPLNELMTVAQRIGNAGDLDHEINISRKDEIGELARTFSSMVNYLHEMSVNVQNMVKSTQVQASSVSETSASIDQMVASIQRVADTAKVLLDISNRSREEVHSGINTMEKATEGLNKINSTIRSSGEI